MTTNSSHIEYKLADISDQLDQLVLRKVDTPELRDFMKDPYIMDGILVVLCLEGSTSLRVNFKEYLLERGKLLVAFPNSLVEPLTVSDDVVVYSFIYADDYVSAVPIMSNYDVWYKLHDFPCIKITEEQVRLIASYFDFMYEMYCEPDKSNKQEVLKYILVALRVEIRTLYSYIEDADQTSLTRTEQITRDFFELLYQHYKEERSVSFYADKLHLTPKYLTTVIREQTNYTILEWISKSVIVTAKELLRTTDKTVLEIAYDLHFSDSSLFCRFFKRNVGVTPNQYRFGDDS